MNLAPGDVFHGRYEIQRRLAETRMSDVYSARDGANRKGNVVVKVPKHTEEDSTLYHTNEDLSDLEALGIERLEQMEKDLSRRVEYSQANLEESMYYLTSYALMQNLLAQHSRVHAALSRLWERGRVDALETEAEIALEMGSRFPRHFPAIIEIIRDTIGKIEAIVMEHISGCDLHDCMYRARRTFQEDEICHIAIEVLLALDENHTLGVINRDLKRENVMLGFNPDETIRHVKLIDFGIAKTLKSDRLRPKNRYCGTPSHAAPEVVSRRVYGRLSDLYAFGVLLYNVCERGGYPFGGGRSVPRAPGERMREMRNTSQFFRELIAELLEEDPERRPQQIRNVIRRIAAYAISQWPQLRTQEPYYSALGGCAG